MLLLMLCLCAGHGAVAQKTATKRVSVSLNNLTYAEAFQVIGEQSGVVFLYSDDILPEGRVSLQMKEVPLENILRRLLEDTEVAFKVLEGEVILKPSKAVAV